MEFLEIIKAIILGIVEGVTEWLPVSSTGHMILVDEFLKLNVSKEFMEMFLVVIQLGAILAVILLYWKKIFPFKFDNGVKVEKDTIIMWVKILIACVPAAIVGLLWDDYLNALFYNPTTVAIMLILFGILFIVIENYNKGKNPKINSLTEITYTVAVMIGLFQLIAAVFPGTSRSGATIVGALLIGVSRTVAAEFTFFLAIPVMLGASALKLVKFTDDNGNISVLMDADDEFVTIRVKDDGSGISKGVSEHIFERFVQEDKSFNRKKEGSGIGLSLVKSLIELHEGTVSLEKEVEKGCEIVIKLPNVRMEEDNDNNSRIIDAENKPLVQKINIEFSDIYELY